MKKVLSSRGPYITDLSGFGDSCISHGRILLQIIASFLSDFPALDMSNLKNNIMDTS
jgi:hypothetical protein